MTVSRKFYRLPFHISSSCHADRHTLLYSALSCRIILYFLCYATECINMNSSSSTSARHGPVTECWTDKQDDAWMTARDERARIHSVRKGLMVTPAMEARRAIPSPWATGTIPVTAIPSIAHTLPRCTHIGVVVDKRASRRLKREISEAYGLPYLLSTPGTVAVCISCKK